MRLNDLDWLKFSRGQLGQAESWVRGPNKLLLDVLSRLLVLFSVVPSFTPQP